MKLFRSDLEQRISNQFFEIEAKSLDLGNLQLVESHLKCTLSVDTLSHGYRVHGAIEAMVHETCDRCLVRFKENFQKFCFKIFFSNFFFPKFCFKNSFSKIFF